MVLHGCMVYIYQPDLEINMPNENEKPTLNTFGDLFQNDTVWTPEIDRMAQFVVKCIRMDLPGASAYGQQRTGKSRACRYLKDALADVLGYPVAVVIWSIPEQSESKKSDREFVQEMMIQSGCDRIIGRDAAVLRRRFYTHLMDLAMGFGSRRIVIIVDEAQNLTRLQYGHLIHCFNSLEQSGIQPFFLLVGQPELANSPDSFAEASGLQVIGRFFSKVHRYRGINLSELDDVLQSFDMPMEEDGLSRLASLFPADYALGWNLSKLTPCFLEAFQMVLKQHNLGDDLRVPMQYLRSSLLNLIYKIVDERLPLQIVSAEMVFTAIKDTDFFSVLAYYAAFEKKLG
jgi:hypothetical protein